MKFAGLCRGYRGLLGHALHLLQKRRNRERAARASEGNDDRDGGARHVLSDPKTKGDAGLRDGQRTLVQQVLASNARSVVAGFGNPYALADFADADALLLYDSTLPSVQSAALILRGHAVAPGRLPVTLRGFPYGSGGAGY